MSAAPASLLLRWRWRLAVAGVAVAALVAAVTIMGAGSASASYRTAEVVTGDVNQALTVTGSIESASRYDVGFQVGGTVAGVDVAVGDSVEAGETLATLDTSDLDDAVTAAQEALASAEQTLADDLEAQSSGTSSTSSSTTTVSYSAESPSTSAVLLSAVYSGAASTATVDVDPAPATPTAVDVARAALVDAQNALLAQYDEAVALLEAANQASADAQETCTAFTSPSADSPSDSGTTVDPAEALAACQEATVTALAASQTSIEAQATLLGLATQVDAAVTALQEAIASDTSATSPDEGATAGGGAGGTGSSGDTGGSESPTPTQGSTGAPTATSTVSVPSAADILADKAEITSAEAALAVAQRQLEFTTLTAPVAGTVIAVGIDAEATVTAGDSSAVVTVIANNSYLVQLSVGLTDAQLLKVGQAATLTLTSTGEIVEGTVSSLSTVNSGNAYSQSYAVTIAIPDPGFTIRIGAATRMEITVSTASSVLVVPTSAVSDAAGDATVLVIGNDGTATTTPIVTGAIGAEYTEVTSGLDAGDLVVLADLTQSLTSDSTSTSDSSGLLGDLSSDTTQGSTSGPPAGGGQPQGGAGGPVAG